MMGQPIPCCGKKRPSLRSVKGDRSVKPSASNPEAINLAGVLECFASPAAIVDWNFRILAANDAYRWQFNKGKKVCGQLCHEVSHRSPIPCSEVGERCPILAAQRSGEPARVIHPHRIDQDEHYERVTAHPLYNESSNVWAFLEIHSPVNFVSTRPQENGKLVGRSPSFQAMLDLMARVAPTSTTVLLLGESGTGKELVARALHELSPRRSGPFIPVECSGLAETLFESELFGHEKGAFTGAYSAKQGLVESGHRGTLFLDEIGDIPLPLQVKLLRLLETGVFRRVGSVRERKSDFRLLCATHRDVENMVETGEFRKDLYFRISAFPIRLPPLRERREDIPILARSIFARLGCGDRCKLDASARSKLEQLSFPGNVRELQNILERACLLSDDGLICSDHLPDGSMASATVNLDPPFPLDSTSVIPIEAIENRYIQWLCKRFSGNRAELASLLGISERTLYRKIQEH